jgi:phosphatidylinositol alpha-mannosyltransferase
MKWVDSRLDGCILVSPALRDSRASYLPAEYRIIPNGIDYTRFAAAQIRPVAPFDDGRPNILFVGRLDARKGFIHLLRAFPAIKQAFSDARLLVVGAFGEEEKSRLPKYIRDEDWQDIHFIGRVSREELPRYYRTATLFCAPSTGGESFGIVLLEAMAAGLPVIASDIAGYRSVMQDGAQGCFVPPGDKEAIVHAIAALLREPERREQMAAVGRATAARYDWHVVAPRVLDYYQELIRVRRRETGHLPFASQNVKQSQKATGVSTIVQYLMKGLDRFESLSASGNPIYH